MRKLFCFLFISLLLSCSEDESPEIKETKLEIAYHGYYEELIGQPLRNLTLTNIKVYPEVKQISETEDIDVLRIEVTSIYDESCFVIEVIADSTGRNVLFNKKFDFRTPEGTPYAYSNLNFEVLVNSVKEFSATFSGKLEHYNQQARELIYIDIRSGSVTIYY